MILNDILRIVLGNILKVLNFFNFGSKAILVDNARHYNPVAIDSTGKNVTYLPINANYIMVGTEKYVNSGWIWPEGLAPPGVPPISSFSVTFEKPGTYNYICSVHPWMAGTIKVS